MRRIIFLNIILVILILVLGGTIAYIYLFESDIKTFVEINNPKQDNITTNFSSYNEDMQFYPNMRYADLPITYLVSLCSEKEVEDTRKAVQILKSRSIINFQESPSPEIEVSCSKESIKKGEHIIAGEGGPNTIINTSLFNIILNSTVLLYTENNCETPILQLHELLHAIGFNHSTDKRSVMYPIQDCNQQLSDDIIAEIDRLYSYPSLPDLSLEDISAFKSGRYLNFNATIKNIGLKDAKNVTLDVYVDDDNKWSTDFGEIKIGYGKTIIVRNLDVKWRFSDIKFIVNEKNLEEELNKNNNVKEMILSD